MAVKLELRQEHGDGMDSSAPKHIIAVCNQVQSQAVLDPNWIKLTTHQTRVPNLGTQLLATSEALRWSKLQTSKSDEILVRQSSSQNLTQLCHIFLSTFERLYFLQGSSFEVAGWFSSAVVLWCFKEGWAVVGFGWH